MRKAAVSFLVLALVLLALAGCGDQAASGPEEVMTEFLDTLVRGGDINDLKPLMTEESTSYIEEHPELLDELMKDEDVRGTSFSVYDVEQEDSEQALVYWKVYREGEEIADSAGLVVTEDGVWKVAFVESMGLE